MSIIVKCPSCGTQNRIKENTEGAPVCGKCKSPLMIQKSSGPIHLSDNDFDTVIRNSSKPVLVDFWAGWCRPCRMMEPVLERFAQSQSSITVAKLNTEENPVIPSKFQIFSIPTMILFDKGKEVHRITGATTLEGLEYELSRWLKIN